MYIKFEDFINEGLIITHDIEKCVNILNKYFNDSSVIVKYITKTNLEIQINRSTDVDEIKKLFIFINNLGYFVTNYIAYSYMVKRSNDIVDLYKTLSNNNVNKLILKFEAKFGEEIINNFTTMYHVYDTKNLDRIMKYGLIQKTNNKQLSHPERIYLTDTLFNANQLINSFKINDLTSKKDYIGDYRILEINMTNNIKLYLDPAYSHGFYTYDNISRYDITIL